MGRPPGDGRTSALARATYFRPRQEHIDLVKEIAADEDRDVSTVIRRIFEAGLEVKYPDAFASLQGGRRNKKRHAAA